MEGGRVGERGGRKLGGRLADVLGDWLGDGDDLDGEEVLDEGEGDDLLEPGEADPSLTDGINTSLLVSPAVHCLERMKSIPNDILVLLSMI